MLKVMTCLPADAGDRKAQKATSAVNTVATKQSSKGRLPPFQAFDVSTGDTVSLLTTYDLRSVCLPFH